MKGLRIISAVFIIAAVMLSCSVKKNPAAAFEPDISGTMTVTPTASLIVFSTSTSTISATPTVTQYMSSTITLTVSSTPTSTVTVTPNLTASPTLNATPPSSAVKIIFIHHSTGQHWLETGYGNLGTALNANNYAVYDTNYGWDAETEDNIGDYTDTVNWPMWFNDTKMPYVYAKTSNSCYTNTIPQPYGDNRIIMFKSCFPNSEVGSDITDEQAIYDGLLAYFAAHTDRLFILIVPPPMQVISNPAATRTLANWLYDKQNGWLRNYTAGNVRVYDYYNVLTHADNHHRVVNGIEMHEVNNTQNTLYYPTSSGDDHPDAAGQQKATSEFVPLLNAWYHQWKGL